MPTADFSHLVTNPKMKQVLSDCGHLDSATLGKGYELKLGVYKHCCTSGPSTWYRKGGINLYWWNGAGPYKASVEDMKAPLQKAGMVAVYHCGGLAAKTEFSRANAASKCRPGDIGSMISASSGHGVMWTGQDWRSDCIEPDGPYPYSQEGRGGDWSFILWRHPSLQEPGTDIMGGGFGNGGPATGGGGSAEMKDFNIEPYDIKEDEKGQYTEEPILVGVANHIHIGTSTSGGVGSYASGEFGDESIFQDLAKPAYADGMKKLRKPDVAQRATYCAKWLASNVQGFNLSHACAIIGVYVDENSCDPHSCCEREKAGGGTGYTQGGGYGAGIGSWTGVDSKRKKLASIGKSADTPIESLSLDEQLQITKKEWESGDKFHKVMWQAKDLVHASIVATYMTHGIGYFQTALNAGNWDIYSQGFHNAMNEESRAQQRKLQNWNHGKDSDYYYGLFHKRYLVAKALMGLCGGSGGT